VKLPFQRVGSNGEPDFTYEADQSDILIRLSQGGRRLLVSVWVQTKPAAASTIAQIEAAAEDGRLDAEGRSLVEVEVDQVRLRPAFVASLDATAASDLRLPAATPLALDLKPVGRIDQDDFRIESRWVEPGGRPVRATATGALLASVGGVRRLPEPLWSLHRIASELAAPVDKTERFRALAELRRLWPDDPRAAIESDAYLRDLRVHYASSLSLKLRALTPTRTDFDPVLFGGRAVQEAGEEGRMVDEDFDNVLTPASQRLFAEDRFRREAEARPVYVLRDGEYIFIDPALRAPLNAVRKLQDRPESERRAFVLNPRRVLREALGEDSPQSAGLDDLFVETEQFSARVAGVDVWRAPVLPWLAPASDNRWLPERFGLRIGDEYFVLPPENVGPLLDKVQGAVDAGHPTAATEGLLASATPGGAAPPHEIPANEQVIAALGGLKPFVPDPGGPGGFSEDPPAPAQEALKGKLFLVVRENFDEVEFAPFYRQAEVEPAPQPPVSTPKRLRTPLKPHQSGGLEWLVRCLSARRPGALLADDMGLGKTLQAIALMAWIQEEAAAGRRPTAPFLIVAPTGLLGTWRDEVVKHVDVPRLGPLVPAFGGDLRALREEGGFASKDIESGKAALRAEAWRDAGIVLTTYETMRDYHFSFARTRFDLVIYDEIQKLKNPASQLTRAAKALNATFTLGMTGTPVENRLQDLWSIMDVIAPGLLGSSRDFEKRYPPTDSTALAHLKAQLTEPRDGLPPYMLRRLKSDELEGLPAKHIHPLQKDMPPAQADAYREIVVRAAASAAAGTVGKGGMLKTLAAMRGVSLHPLDPRQAPSDLDAYAADSARLCETLSVLEAIAGKNEKALIFLEDLAMQERLAGLIEAHFKLPSAPMRINGAVPGPKRQAIVERFQGNRGRFDVMILSPKAGGVGLTLTSANHVIHLSRWWNPAVEDQATDRVFRIGQTRDVHVYLPLAVHPDTAIRDSSFDLRLNSLMDRKRQLTQDLFLPPDLADAELSELFREVSLGGEATAPTPEDPAAPAKEAPVAATSRPTLTLSKELTSAGVRAWRKAPGESRPTDEIVSLFAGKNLAHVIIRDPYALGHRNSRQAQVQFVARLTAACRSCDAVTVEYAPEVEGDLEEGQARREFGAIYGKLIPTNAPKLTLARRSKRSRDDDFHDRFVEFDVRHAGGAVRRHELTIGRGLEALFDGTKQCTATYTPPQADR
jgi:superfamily II DNA or RNA helicase